MIQQLPVVDRADAQTEFACVALVGNPNAGKTSLFNALTGLRAKTANFPGITVDLREGVLHLPDRTIELVDLPGLYSLDALSPEETVTEAFLRGDVDGGAVPKVVLLVLDATNLERNLFLASEILELNLPTVIALNMMDAAAAADIQIDLQALESKLGCPVVPVSARTGAGLKDLCQTIDDVLCDRLGPAVDHPACTMGCSGCVFADRYDWARGIVGDSVQQPTDHGRTADAIDRVVTTPLAGIATFVIVMLGVFYLIFSLADIPMALIEQGFGQVANIVGGLIPAAITHPWLWSAGTFAVGLLAFAGGYRLKGIPWSWRSSLPAVAVSGFIAQLPVEDFRSLVTDGVIGGVGGVVVFLPQICILFFFISLLEDSGYMAARPS